MIVNPDVVDVYSIAKKNENTPKNAKNNNLKNTRYQNVNWRGPSFYISLPGGQFSPSPPRQYVTASNRSGRPWHGEGR